MAKRAFDITFSLLGLVVLAPVLITLGLVIRLTSPGPIFYQATRVGQHGQLIQVYKFRSMVVNADQMGGAVTTKNDPRVTPIGRFMRRYKLDELPQLINVFIGTMSLVGPRPEHPRYVALYTPEQRAVLQVRPGITSPASLAFRSEEELLDGPDWENHYITHILPAKLDLDLAYAQQPGLLTDIRLILQTIRALITSPQSNQAETHSKV